MASLNFFPFRLFLPLLRRLLPWLTPLRRDDDVRDHANLDEAAKREAQWREAGYHVISMKNDFKTIYGDGVVKTDFTFPVKTTE